MNPPTNKDVLVIGREQSALGISYYLRKTSQDYLIVDQQQQAGGSWSYYWESLRLFTSAQELISRSTNAGWIRLLPQSQ